MITKEQRKIQLSKYSMCRAGSLQPTPIELVNEMISKFDELLFQNPDSKFLDPTSGTGSFLIALYRKLIKYHSHEHIINNMIYGNDISPTSEKFGINLGFVNITKADFKKFGKDLNKLKKIKFAGIVMNPSYSHGSHMNHFNNAFELLKEGGTIVCIHPATPFITRKPLNFKGRVKKIQSIINTYETELKIINGNSFFNVQQEIPLSITTVIKRENKNINVIYSHYNTDDSIQYNSLDNVFIHGNDIVLSIRDKIFEKMNQSLEDYTYRNGATGGNVYLRVNTIATGIPNNGAPHPNFNTFLGKMHEHDISSRITQTPIGKNKKGTPYNEISFKNEKELENGKSYLLTKFARFCLSLFKVNQHLESGELKAVPYLDFSKKWSDRKLKKYFKLSNSEWDFINEYIPDRYDSDLKN